ncbi:MAG: DUF2752 domain-containing protein [Clostridiales Family XIII bacterium]|jgi:hypothetical protein|nr:DUF2752 domain-containing protein [Clostridiales Family XIII bacterium]
MLKRFAVRNKAKIVGGSVGAATAFAFLFGCPFRLITGIPCPGCGMTHAFLAAFRFDFADAFRWHPLFPLVMLMMAGYAACLLVFFVRRRDGITRVRPAEISVMTRALVDRVSVRALLMLYAILFFGVYLIRMAAHYQPLLLHLP